MLASCWPKSDQQLRMENQIKSSLDKQRVLSVKVLVVSFLIFDLSFEYNYEDREMTLPPFVSAWNI